MINFISGRINRLLKNNTGVVVKKEVKDVIEPQSGIDNKLVVRIYNNGKGDDGNTMIEYHVDDRHLILYHK